MCRNDLPSDSDQTQVHSSCLKFAGPPVFNSRNHLLILFFNITGASYENGDHPSLFINKRAGSYYQEPHQPQNKH